MRIELLALAVAIVAAGNHWGVEEDNDVAVLNKDNFDQFIKDHKYVFVKFYAPWCGHCKSMAPGYSKLARRMKEADNGVPITKVDATVEKDLGEKFGIKGFPTLKFFINGEPVDYSGAREEEPIYNWIQKKTGPASKEITEVADFEKFQKKSVAVLLVYPEGDTKTVDKYQTVAANYDDLAFAHTSSSEIKETLGLTKDIGVVVFRDFDDGIKKKEFKGFYPEDVKEFIDDVKFPLVMEFNQQAAERIFGGEKSAIIFFADKPNEELLNNFRELAKTYKSEILFSHSKISQDLGARLAEYIGITAADENSARIVKFAGGNLNKYKCDGNDRSSLEKCLKDFKTGSLEAYYKSEPTPASNDEPVKIITGNTFRDLVIDSDKHVLLEVYAPWCGHCKQLAPIYDELAKKLQGINDIVIAKMDGTANEYAGLNVQGFPTLKFYKKGKKSSPMDFSGDRTVDGFIKFLEKETGIKVGKDKEASNETKDEEL